MSKDGKTPLSTYKERLRYDVDHTPTNVKQQFMDYMNSGIKLGEAARLLGLTTSIAAQIMSDNIEITKLFSIRKKVK